MSDQLRSIYARWQNLEADKAAISEDLKGIIARLTYDPVTGSLFWSDPGADNRLANLRLATRAENTRNRRRPNANGSSGVKGVHWHNASGKWCASIGFAGNRRHLGVFADKDSAAAAYRQAELTLFGAFAHRQEA